MIKQASFFRMSAPIVIDANSLPWFIPTAPTQEKSMGWIEPNAGSMVESVSGAQVLKFAIETRKVPAATIQKKLGEACLRIEQTTGRKPGKMEKKGLKEEIKFSLLPHAFPAQRHITVIIDDTLLIIESTSPSQVDDVLSAIVRLFDVEVSNLNVQTSPSELMAEWLTDHEATYGFEIGRACELRAQDETSAKVRYTNHYLGTDEVQTHIAQGKIPVSLSLSFDADIECTLTDALTLKKITFSDHLFEGSEPDFYGSMTIVIGGLRTLILELILALGGEHA